MPDMAFSLFLPGSSSSYRWHPPPPVSPDPSTPQISCFSVSVEEVDRRDPVGRFVARFFGAGELPPDGMPTGKWTPFPRRSAYLSDATAAQFPSGESANHRFLSSSVRWRPAEEAAPHGPKRGSSCEIAGPRRTWRQASRSSGVDRSSNSTAGRQRTRGGGTEGLGHHRRWRPLLRFAMTHLRGRPAGKYHIPIDFGAIGSGP